MESWEGYNYYTTNPEEWVKLMNLSTTEWSIGFLPAGVVAIPGPINASYEFPAGTFVIENASRTNFGSRDIEKVIFGVASAIVLLWALPWFGYRLHKGTLLNPRGSTHHGETDQGDGNPLRPASPRMQAVFGGYVANELMPVNRFKRELDGFYENVQTELELHEKTVQVDGVSTGDVESGTELLRKLYDNILGLWAAQNAQEVTYEDRALLAAQSSALVDDLKRLLQSWTATPNDVGWSREEQLELGRLVEAMRSLPEPRNW